MPQKCAKSGGVAPSFVIFTLNGCEWSVSRPSSFTPLEKASATHFGGWVGPQSRPGRYGEVEDMMSLAWLELRPPTILTELSSLPFL
jgi:hypothetical protein